MTPEQLTTYNLQNASYIATIVSAVVVVVTLMFAAITIYKSGKEYAENNKKDRFARAVEIAKEYVDIISDISFIQSVILRDKSMVALLNKLPLNKLNEFSLKEFKLLITDNNEEEYLRSFFREGNINTEILLTSYALKNRCIPISQPHYNGDNISASQMGVLITQEYYETMSDVLNKLEYISMSLNFNVSDEETLFPSLHHSFLTTVHMLYVPIALINKNYSDKFYTNVTELFIKWRDRDMQNKQMEHDKEQRNADLKRAQQQMTEMEIEKNERNAKEQIQKTPQPLKK